MKTLKRLVAILCAAALFALPMSVYAAGATFTVETKTVEAGTSVPIAITLDANSGIAGILMSVTYDKALTLTAVNGGTALSTMTFTPGGDLSANPFNLLWDGTDSDTSTGTIVTLTFKAPSASGNYPIKLTYGAGNIIDGNYNDVPVTINAGAIVVTGGTTADPGTTTDPGTSTGTTDPGTSTGTTDPGTSTGTTTDPGTSTGTTDPGTSTGTTDPGTSGAGTSTAAPKFSDVADTAWYHDAVSYVAQKGLMSGTGATTFSPESTMTRAMLMTVLARYAGVDTSGGSTWYEKGMNWAKENGVSDGTNPSGNITREQLATMLYRYAQKQGKGFTGTWTFLLDYPDRESVSDWAYEAMCWMTMNKVINGMGDGTLNPKGSATRAQVATMLMRFVELD